MPFDITRSWPKDNDHYDFIIHGASIASPIYYRKYPLETIDANILGLRSMLDRGREWKCDSVLFFSSSEIYGDPPPDEIPTKESYRGSVSCIGPRACYDESKRLGETLCYLYATEFRVPVKIVRPFNNYGPGLRLTDGRVLTDFCRNVLNGTDIVLYSDGRPTRTFCYASDALTGYLLALLSPHQGEPFNIGSDVGEISMQGLGEMLLAVAKSPKKVIKGESEEKHYLTDNPNRRCPDLEKARTLLGYAPAVALDTGLNRTLEWYKRFVALEELT
jgi:UDP-glucuronate decarboxylase